MELNRVTIEDYESIIAFYDDVTGLTPEIATYARWSKRKHPTLEGIKAYIEEGSMYLYKEEKVIVGAVAVTMYQGEDYHAIEWSQQVADDKAAVIHILAVSPDYQGKGIGSEMVREAINLAKEKGMEAIRLDALSQEQSAQQLREITGVANPRSVTQMKQWLSQAGLSVDTLGKKDVQEMMKGASEPLRSILSLRLELAKSSVKKYTAMKNAVCADG